MPSFQYRAVDLVELMDDPACDRELLFRTYAQFALINPLLARWRSAATSRVRWTGGRDAMGYGSR